jgi:hypothetical protein
MSPEERAARERKQKIFVVAGGLFLVALLAIQLPKLLGGSSESTAAETTTPIAAAQAVATAAGGAPVFATIAAPSTSAPEKLTSLSMFARKDPFVQQQVVADTALASAAETAKPGVAKGGDKTTGPATKAFTTGAAGAAVTIVTVNGARQVLEPGMKFPAADPIFVLVAENPGSKSVVVGVAGGAYAGGATKTKLRVGHPLTLVNTTTDARYKISLVSVGSGQPAAQAPSQAQP